ncbi:MAG: glycosyltransferase [Candidatus Aminicenantales bacterium]|jgi:glycosyltransferase involved in cell wall biosynthesis
MRLLIDCLTIGSQGGLNLRNELANAVTALEPKNWQTFWIVPDKMGELPGGEKANTIVHSLPKHGWIGQWRWYQYELPALASRLGIDVVYSMSGILSARIRKSFGTIVSFTNILPFAPFRHRQYSPLSKEAFKALLHKHLLLTGAGRADVAVMFCHRLVDEIEARVTGFKTKCFTQLYAVPSDLNFEIADPPPHPYARKPYFFYLSPVHPYKNHLRLLEAYRLALHEMPGLPDLIVAGAPAHPRTVRKIEAFIRSSGLSGKAAYLRRLPREQVSAWLYHADFNIFPSLCEANSLVFLEIMGVGGALACSNNTFDRLGGDSYFEFFDPESIEDIKNTLLKLACDPARLKILRSKAFELGSRFSWGLIGEAIWAAAQKAESSYRERRKIYRK